MCNLNRWDWKVDPRMRNLVALILGVICVILVVPFVFSRGRDRHGNVAKMDVLNILAALTQYEREFGTFPIGDRIQVLKLLRGENPREIVFFSVAPERVNSKGEFMDGWGTPYDIQILSSNSVSVRSAGPNKIFGDKDDIATEERRR